GAAQLVDLAAHELFPSAPVLGDQSGVDQHLDVLLHRGEADRIQPAELADGALTVERLGDDVAPCCIAEREEQPIGPLRALESFYNHLVVDYPSRRRCQAASARRATAAIRDFSRCRPWLLVSWWRAARW